MFAPVHCSITDLYPSQMLMKRYFEASCFSMQSPIHPCGTPFFLQHSSKIKYITFIFYKDEVFLMGICYFMFYSQFTWTKLLGALFCHFGISFTGCPSIELYLFFESMFFSQPISARCRAISKFPVTPFAIN